jgi:hypothetical protein
MIIDIPPHQQASLDRAWAKRMAAGEAVKAAKAAYKTSNFGFDTKEGHDLYRAWKAAEAIERKRSGVCRRLDFLYRYKPEMDKQA